jgi:hypothetical protein
LFEIGFHLTAPGLQRRIGQALKIAVIDLDAQGIRTRATDVKIRRVQVFLPMINADVVACSQIDQIGTGAAGDDIIATIGENDVHTGAADSGLGFIPGIDVGLRHVLLPMEFSSLR